MDVMRQQHDNILTLLEVLLYDPLYVWTVTPQKAAAVQRRRGTEPTTLNLTFSEEGIVIAFKISLFVRNSEMFSIYARRNRNSR